MLHTPYLSLRSIDWINLCITLILSFIGLFFVMSATYCLDQPYSIFFKKQAWGLISGMLIYSLFSCIDYRFLMRYGYFAYFGVLLLLVYTAGKGTIGMGAQRWLSFGFITIQPSELCKLFFPAFMAYYLHTHHDGQKDFTDFMPIIVLFLITTFLVLKQPDLGTALLLFLTGSILLIHAGFSKKWFIAFLCLGLLCAPAVWSTLKPYQKQRIMVFLGHGDQHKERYQIEQSKIAIGSGGLFGKGHCKGTQNIFQFLPESRTDFIFAVIAEEWGFFGSLFVLVLYALLAFNLLLLVYRLHNISTQILALGLSLHIILSIIINIAMVLGLLPIVGIPLPLLSYGISNLWVVLASLGWLQGIASKM